MTEDRWEAFGDYDDDRKFNEGIKFEHERIFTILKQLEKTTFPGDVWNHNPFTYAMQLIDGENE